MIKLDTTAVSTQAGTVIVIESTSDVPCVNLSTTDAWKAVEEDFARDDTKRKQVVSFIQSGRTCEMIGAVAEADAVECPGSVWRVVAVAEFKTDKKTMKLNLVIGRIVEVWAAPGKKLWEAKDWNIRKVQGGATLTPDGHISRASTAGKAA